MHSYILYTGAVCHRLAQVAHAGTGKKDGQNFYYIKFQDMKLRKELQLKN
jgi:hypothetical protein